MTDQPSTLDRLREAVERAEKTVAMPLSDAGPYFTRAAQLGVAVQAEQSVRIADALEVLAGLRPKPERRRSVEVHPPGPDGSVLISDHATGRSQIAQPGDTYTYGTIKVTVTQP